MIGRIIGITIKSITLVIGLALGFALTFTGLFFIGIPIIILSIWLFSRMIKKERQKTYGVHGMEPISTKEENNGEEQTYSAERGNGDSAIRGNPVADAAASYLIGKAVSDKLEGDRKQRKKHFISGNNCATCEYWVGERIAKKQDYYKGAECPDRCTNGTCGCKSGPYYRRSMMCGSGACKSFERWRDC